MLKYTAWAGGNVSLDNNGDELLLLNEDKLSPMKSTSGEKVGYSEIRNALEELSAKVSEASAEEVTAAIEALIRKIET